jgi:hypothetical protein
MAVKIEYVYKHATAYVHPTSRYAASQVILLGEKKVPAFALYKGRNKDMAIQNMQWTEIAPNVEYRPDLVSYELFGTPDFWWRLLEINGMSDIMEFKAGRTILVPNSLLP